MAELRGRLDRLRATEAGRLFLFLCVGGVNTAAGYLFFVAAVLLGASAALAVMIATVAGVAFNFATTGKIVFASTAAGRLPRFVLVYCGQYGLNLALLGGLRRMGASLLLAEALTLPLVAVATYAALNILVFPRRRGSRPSAPLPHGDI